MGYLPSACGTIDGRARRPLFDLEERVVAWIDVLPRMASRCSQGGVQSRSGAALELSSRLSYFPLGRLFTTQPIDIATNPDQVGLSHLAWIPSAGCPLHSGHLRWRCRPSGA
ncbi:hypothetical protein Nepgr_006375 [Nepenthes gracilis]|uniref:Uncharacterized protein n=1 Tax=Nepenthes gracilis TaxID=150966 RepID=A0AAD3S5E2_NEPGR|nr:hypothetical protein Nepgr_006375 [Nepenthes gracilis]